MLTTLSFQFTILSGDDDAQTRAALALLPDSHGYLVAE